MRLVIPIVLFAIALEASQGQAAIPPQPDSHSQPQEKSTPDKATITVPAGTKVILALTSPVWAKTVKLGDSVYSASAFPVAVNDEMAIPPGTYVEGKIDALTRPTWRSNRAEFQMHFSKMIFANGYTVELPGAPVGTAASASQSATKTASTTAADGAPAETATAEVYVQVNFRSDILLDNGSQIEMVLQSPLSLDAGNVAAAVRRSKPLQIGQYKSATRCVPTAGTPGSPDTVIPGTPATPPTVIPGGPGMPDTVIPGSPGTPSTVIPGSPGFPGTSCPGPPIVKSAPDTQDVHTKSFQVQNPVQIAGTRLTKGKYQVTWTGLGPTAQVDILQKSKLVVRVEARVVALGEKAPIDQLTTHINADGSVSLNLLQFKGEDLAISFD
jgi:hypothetical protein